VCLLITDGNQTRDNSTKDDEDLLPNAVKPLINKGVLMFALGITKNVEIEELYAITNHYSGRVVLAKDFDILPQKLNQLKQILCHSK